VRKSLKWMCVLALMALPAVGCRPHAELPQSTGANNGSSVKCPTIRLPGEFEVPTEIGEWAQVVSRLEGVYVLRRGQSRYVVIAMGERPTGGYAVVLNAASEQPDALVLEVTYREPGPHEFVTQAFTYPYLLLQLETERELRVNLLGPDGSASALPIHEHEEADASAPIRVRLPVPFQGVRAVLRVAGRAHTAGPLYACVEDGHLVLLEETELALTPAGDGWYEFDQEFVLRPATSPYGSLVLWFQADERVRTVVPLCLPDWSYENK